jgi:dTMP kinase
MPLIVFEGIDGCGKSTQCDLLLRRLAAAGVRHRHFRDPGGTRLGEQQRRLLLDPANRVSPLAELFGYLQSRSQLVDECLAPALAADELVVLDRFYHSTVVYQAFGLGLDRARVESAVELGTAGVRPDLVIYLRLDPVVATRRRGDRDGDDRIEGRGAAYLRRVHDGYETLAAEGRITTVDADRPTAVIAAEVWDLVAPFVPVTPATDP